ncbi:hypothetical protein [Bradyrhizobium sp. 153]|uniref:hypothetical protein n=1 Tax=Bradyrhizobium sp. 153 TaxID=2782627 RepID=UPI001FF77FDE|nr:hypothetical protein [Bradyrhizobium sp. 153]MCK1668684.1 hypothetical protein [Bradyrhizobium sp. 153]
MGNKVVRIIPHEESIEVRVSTFIYFDDDPGRRSINGRVSRDDAVEEAKRIASAERDG